MHVVVPIYIIVVGASGLFLTRAIDFEFVYNNRLAVVMKLVKGQNDTVNILEFLLCCHPSRGVLWYIRSHRYLKCV